MLKLLAFRGVRRNLVMVLFALVVTGLGVVAPAAYAQATAVTLPSVQSVSPLRGHCEPATASTPGVSYVEGSMVVENLPPHFDVWVDTKGSRAGRIRGSFSVTALSQQVSRIDFSVNATDAISNPTVQLQLDDRTFVGDPHQTTLEAATCSSLQMQAPPSPPGSATQQPPSTWFDTFRSTAWDVVKGLFCLICIILVCVAVFAGLFGD